MVKPDVEDQSEEREIEMPLDDKQNSGDSNGDSNEDSNEESEPKSRDLLYAQRRWKNIEELKAKLTEVKAQYPIFREGQERKNGLNKAVSKKKAGLKGPIVIRESQRQVLS